MISILCYPRMRKIT